jgi:hypothetical protein
MLLCLLGRGELKGAAHERHVAEISTDAVGDRAEKHNLRVAEMDNYYTQGAAGCEGAVRA